MITTTPKVGHLISWEGCVTNDLSEVFIDAITEMKMKKRGANEVLDHIVRDCMIKEDDKANRLTRFYVRAVVMAPEEFKQAIESAYQNGINDAYRKFNRIAQ